MIAKESLEQLKQVLDIVEVVQSYIDLKKVGINYQAICPFHDERTPSFIVSPHKNSFRCYGCSKGGNAITFVMEYEKLDFMTAVQKLADMFHVCLEYTTTQQPPKHLDVLEQIARCYQEQLSCSALAQNYLAKRGVSAQSIKDFGLGFCTQKSVEAFIAKAHLDRRALLELGVLGQDGGQEFVRFNNRLMFPIHNPHGKIVGFGGRVLHDDPSVAKYINSPQNPLFNKSKLLYGYFLAREAVFKQKQILITEGYLDVILLHQAGFKMAVATLGTALTPEHLPVLNRGNPSIIVGYDGDRAGREAAFRASQLLAKELKSGGVVIFDPGVDPAEMIAQGQTGHLQTLLNRPIRFIEFVLRLIRDRHDLGDPLQKTQALKATQDFLHDLPLVLQEDYKQMAAHLLEIPQTSLIRLQRQRPGDPIYPSGERAICDPLEELLIKYMACDHTLIQKALAFIRPEHFKHCRAEFEALCLGQFDHARLVAIMLEDRLPIVENGFEAQLALFIQRHCEQQLAQFNVLYAHLSPSERIAIMDGWKKKRYQSKQGELVKIWKR